MAKIYQKSGNMLVCFVTEYVLTFNDQWSHHIETSQLICSANQLTGLYMMGTLVVKGLIQMNSSK